MMNKDKNHIIIVGAGFGGLYAAKKLLKRNNDIHITIIDKRNFHLFQPLLYQVAAAQLSPEDIAYPVRAIFEKHKNVTVLKEKVSSVDLDKKCINVECGDLYYDKLIISAGVLPDFFGNDKWRDIAPPLKTLEDALKIRGKVLNIFERAESEMLHPCDEYPLNFVIIGGGPTGIELSGALAELRKYTLKNEFRKIRPERAKIYLIEAGKTILAGFPEKLIKSAENSLAKLDITVRTNCFVTNIEKDKVEIESNETKEIIHSKVVLWAAGVKAKFGNNILSGKENIEFDKKGRVMVSKNLTIPKYENVYVIGDFSNFIDENGNSLPGIAPVAMQQGIYAAKHILAKLKNKTISPFKYFDKGKLAVIGRNAAIADFRNFQVSGFPAWLLWVFVHIGYLVGFNNRLQVMMKWAWDYFNKRQTSRIMYYKN